MYDFIFGNRHLSCWQQGITIAASWAWGVSVIVGMQVFHEKGIEAFIIWGTANSLALIFVGWLFTLVPVHTLTLHNMMPKQIRKPYFAMTYLIQFFSVLVNITAIKLACAMLGSTCAWVVVVSLITLGVTLKGFSHTVSGNIIKFILWMVLLGFVVFQGNYPAFSHSLVQDMHWSLYGALILFCAPILDQQMWQRRSAFILSGMRPFALASLFFAVYIILVGLSAATGGPNTILVAIVILLVAGSTLSSALSAISCYHSDLTVARKAIVAVCLFAVMCTTFNLSVIQIWTAYGSLRIPFACLGIYVIFNYRPA